MKAGDCCLDSWGRVRYIGEVYPSGEVRMKFESNIQKPERIVVITEEVADIIRSVK